MSMLQMLFIDLRYIIRKKYATAALLCCLYGVSLLLTEYGNHSLRFKRQKYYVFKINEALLKFIKSVATDIASPFSILYIMYKIMVSLICIRFVNQCCNKVKVSDISSVKNYVSKFIILTFRFGFGHYTSLILDI